MLTERTAINFNKKCAVYLSALIVIMHGEVLQAQGAEASTQANAITWGGYFDFYYGYNFNQPRAVTPNTSAASSAGTSNQSLAGSQNGSYRNFDIYHNQLEMNQAELWVTKKGKEVSFKADFDFGNIPEITHNGGGAAANGSIDQVSKHVGQAVLSYTPSEAPNLTVSVGKMVTHMGLETIKARDNWQYSRSILFSSGIPYWHSGVQVAYAWLPGKLSTSGFVYNGWNNLVGTNVKTYGLQVSGNPTESLAINYNLIAGAGVSNGEFRTVHDVNAVYNLCSDLSLSADYIYGSLGNTKNGENWEALQVAAKYTVTSRYSVSPRFEHYWDRGTSSFTTTGAVQQLTEVTLTQSLALSEGLEARLEGRWDHSTQSTLGASAKSGPSKNQLTAVLGMLYNL